MHPIKTFAEVWNREEAKAVAQVTEETTPTEPEQPNADDAQHVEAPPEISDIGQHPEVQNQPDPGNLK